MVLEMLSLVEEVLSLTKVAGILEGFGDSKRPFVIAKDEFLSMSRNFRSFRLHVWLGRGHYSLTFFFSIKKYKNCQFFKTGFAI